MAEVLRLPDGSAKICFEGEEQALGELIEEKLGADAKAVYDSVIAGRNDAVKAYEELLDSQDEKVDKTYEPVRGGFYEDAML